MNSFQKHVCLEHSSACHQACSCEQEGLDARVRKKEEAKLARLREAVDAHRASERERAYAVRYHKARPHAAYLPPVATLHSAALAYLCTQQWQASARTNSKS